MKGFKRSIIDGSITHYKGVIWAIILVTLVAGAFFPLVTMDTDPENMLEQDEPARVFHNLTKDRFNLSDTVVVGVINNTHPDGVFNPETLKRVYELTRFARNLQWPDAKDPERTTGVVEVDMIAPSMVDHMSSPGPGTIRFEWLMPGPPETRDEALAVRDRVLSNPLLKGQMVSEDGRALCLYLPLTDKLLSYRVYTALRNKIAELGGEEDWHITGLPVAEGAIGVEMFTQMSTASPLAMVVVFLLLLVFFRRWFLVVLPMIISTVSIVVSMGVMIATGFPVHILSSMLPIFLMSIAMVDCVHVLSEFFDVYTPEKGRRETIRKVMNTLFTPMLYTSLTTAVGFLSLTLAPIPPARVFGIFLCLGVLVAWLVTIVFVPAYIMLVPEAKLARFGLAARKRQSPDRMTRVLAWIGRLTSGHARKALAVMMVLVMVAVWGITRIRVNDNYAKRFDHSHPLRQADTVLNDHFSGTYTAYLVLEGHDGHGGQGGNRASSDDPVGVSQELDLFARGIEPEFPEAPGLAVGIGKWMMIENANADDSLAGMLEKTIDHITAMEVHVSDDDFYALQELKSFLAVQLEGMKVFKRPDVLAYMARLQAHLEDTGIVGKITSVADVVSKVNQELTDGRPESFRVPDKLQSVSECYMQYQQSHRPHDLWHLVTPDYMRANITMLFPSGDSTNTQAAVDAVDAYILHHPLPAGMSYRWAGLHYINLVLEDKLVFGFLESLIGSFLIVLIMMSVLFRSTLWGLLCMVPLSVTLVIIYGTVGIMGKDYDLPIAVLSALSIGMAVDFAIHFLERGRSAYRKHGSWKRAVPEVFGEPARAITRNVLVIAMGFLPLMVASLVPYKTTGLMLFMILSCSGLITLLVLPSVLTVGEGLLFRKVGVDDQAPVPSCEDAVVLETVPADKGNLPGDR
jgi:hypothetical protein